MFEDYPDILTVEEACEALRVGQNAMYQLLSNNKLKAYKKWSHSAHPSHRTYTVHLRKRKNQADVTRTPPVLYRAGEHCYQNKSVVFLSYFSFLLWRKSKKEIPKVLETLGISVNGRYRIRFVFFHFMNKIRLFAAKMSH